MCQVDVAHPKDSKKVQFEQYLPPKSSASYGLSSKELLTSIPSGPTLRNAVIDERSSSSADTLPMTNTITPTLHAPPTALPLPATAQALCPGAGAISPKMGGNVSVTPSRPMTASTATLTDGPRKPAILGSYPQVGLPLNTRPFVSPKTPITLQSKPKSQPTVKPTSNPHLLSACGTPLQNNPNLSGQRLSASSLPTDAPTLKHEVTLGLDVSPAKAQTPHVPASTTSLPSSPKPEVESRHVILTPRHRHPTQGTSPGHRVQHAKAGSSDGDSKGPKRTPLTELNSEHRSNTNGDQRADLLYGEDIPCKPEENPHLPSPLTTSLTPDGANAMVYEGSIEPNLPATNESAPSHDNECPEYDPHIDDGDPDDDDNAEWTWEHNKKKAEEWGVEMNDATLSDPCYTAPLLTRWMHRIRINGRS